MVEWLVPPASRDSLYPDSDGKPMSDNTTQFRWIAILVGNLMALFRDRLAELSRKARRGLATEEELQELDHLESQSDV